MSQRVESNTGRTWAEISMPKSSNDLASKSAPIFHYFISFYFCCARMFWSQLTVVRNSKSNISWRKSGNVLALKSEPISRNKCCGHCKFLLLFIIVNVVDGEMLVITKVSRLHMAAYLCVASNGVPPSMSKRVLLRVQCKFQSLHYACME